jgi:hypothetical protein
MRNRLVTVVLEAEQPRRLAKTAPSVQQLRGAPSTRWQNRQKTPHCSCRRDC